MAIFKGPRHFCGDKKCRTFFRPLIEGMLAAVGGFKHLDSLSSLILTELSPPPDLSDKTAL